jgi:hypothetical protein
LTPNPWALSLTPNRGKREHVPRIIWIPLPRSDRKAKTKGIRQTDRLSDPVTVARKLVEIAGGVEAAQNGRIYIELINGPFIFELRGSPAQYAAGTKHAIECGWIEMHQPAIYVKFAQTGAEMFA